jgi:hypothetical protein
MAKKIIRFLLIGLICISVDVNLFGRAGGGGGSHSSGGGSHSSSSGSHSSTSTHYYGNGGGWNLIDIIYCSALAIGGVVVWQVIKRKNKKKK